MERYRNSEADRPEETRLLTRTDLSGHARKFVARATMIKYATIIRLFEEFCHDVLGYDPGVGETYFEFDCPTANMEMLRRFIFFLADGGQGCGGGRITCLTATTFVQSTIGAMAYRRGRPMDPQIVE